MKHKYPDVMDLKKVGTYPALAGQEADTFGMRSLNIVSGATQKTE